jgi:hypothetical protein
MPAQGIPASQIASVIPGVLAAGGTGLDLIGLALTTSTRPPIGEVLNFTSPEDVADYFGLNSPEGQAADTYFLGYEGSTILPAALLFAQYPQAAAVQPYLRGGPVGSALTLAQLKAVAPGDLGIIINGVAYTSSSINLASATSYSAAAALIQTALTVNDAAFTGIIAPETAATTGSISDNVMTTSAIASGLLVVGGVLSGTGVAAGTVILKQITGLPGEVGTYEVFPGGQSVSTGSINETYGQLTASGVTGLIAAGQVIAGAGVTAGSTITAEISGTGGAGTYVTQTQTVSSEAMTGGAVSVTYDSVSEAFVILGGTPGTPGTITFGTGAIATALLLTAATGAVLSQGAPQASPVSFMEALFDGFQNFGSFFTMFPLAAADAVSFAQWTDSLGTEVAFDFWDASVANTTVDPETAYATIQALNLSGTIPFYAPTNTFLDGAFVAGYIASLNFNQTNGRANLAFRTQPGLAPEVLTGSVSSQLQANRVNFYGTFSTPSENFTYAYAGVISGIFLWVDSFVNACWLKNLIQNAIMLLLGSVGNIPYNAAGYALIAETLGGGPATDGQLAGPIQQALNFGAIRTGITLSSTQIAALNNSAGQGAAAALTSQGWYLQISPTVPGVRRDRGSPPITLWYSDGQSVQKISISQINVQ